jgi:hypothetical protein
MGFLDGALSIISYCFRYCEPLVSRCVSICSDLARPTTNAHFHSTFSPLLFTFSLTSSPYPLPPPTLISV